MKILKPGKVEMRKFVCDCCGCVFLRSMSETAGKGLASIFKCPQEGCTNFIQGSEGEPYEEPTQDTDADAKKIVAIAQQWLRDDRTASLWMLADKLIANGVIFREG